jgi:hypothetical protein
VLSDLSTASDDEESGSNLRDVPEEEELEEPDDRHDFEEEFESDLDETVQGEKKAVHDWSEIRKDVKVLSCTKVVLC